MRLAVALLLALAATARAMDPELVWRTLESRHFVIHYYAGEERLARRLAVVAEDAHAKLAPLLDHEPRRKTHVVLSDDTDQANGFALVQPYPFVHLYATAPEDRSELNDYDDWLSALILHEYTHVLHLDTIHGLARVVNFLFGFGEYGQLYAPNQAQPRFVIEGLAVLEESERTGGGRLRSTIYDMFLRAAALEGRFQRLDQFSNTPIAFPRGASPYLYGSAFLRYIADRFGGDVWRRVSHDYGGSWIPLAMNRSLRRVTGHTYQELYADFKASRVARYRRQLDAIAANGITPSTVLTRPRELALRPAFTPDGREVIWADSDGYTRQQLRRIAVDGSGRPRTLLEVDAPGGVAVSRDGGTVYFDAADVYRNVYLYRDLYALDLARGETRRLTNGLRAAEPDLSPDGKTLAFDVNEAGARSLVTMPAAGGPLTRLLGNSDDLSQVYTPAWSPDGKWIAFSWWRDGGWRDIWLIEVATRRLVRVTADRALDLDPRFSPDGKWLYFSSDRGGVYNLYAWERASGRTFQVTNVIGGAFDVAISPDGERAVYVGFEADGWRLEAIELDPARWRPAVAPLLDRPDVPVPRGLSTAPSRAYSPWSTLLPRTLSLSLYPDAFGQVIGVGVGGSDAVGFHGWSLGVGFGLGRADDVTVAADYRYYRWFPTLGLSARRALAVRGGLMVDGVNHSYVEEDWSLTALAALPVVARIDHASSLTFSYNLAWLRNVDGPPVPLDPNQITPKLPETGRVATLGLVWSWSNVHRYTFSISPAEGRALTLSVGIALPALGSQYEVLSASWSFTEYVPLPWRSHVLALGYAGGVSGGDLAKRGVFFLGGYAPQPDLLRSFFDFTRPGGASLRGYPFGALSGDQFHVLNAEYEFPLADVERGYATLPLYLRRLHGAVFADYGDAFSGRFDPAKLRLGVGAELRLEVLIAYNFPAALQLGFAHGFMAGGEDQLYFYLNNPF